MHYAKHSELRIHFVFAYNSIAFQCFQQAQIAIIETHAHFRYRFCFACIKQNQIDENVMR